MARFNRDQLPMQQPAPQVVYMPDPAMQAELQWLSATERETRRLQQRLQFEIWQQRQARIAASDRQIRRFMFGFGAILGLAFLALVVFVGWWLWTAVGLGMLAIPVLLFGATVTAVGGHRCITIVQHWH
jgi:hypothetical protein